MKSIQSPKATQMHRYSGTEDSTAEDSAVVMTEDSAATAIQSAYRNYRAKKLRKSMQHIPSACGDQLKRDQIDFKKDYMELLKPFNKTVGTPLPNNQKVLTMFSINKNSGLDRKGR